MCFLSVQLFWAEMKNKIWNLTNRRTNEETEQNSWCVSLKIPQDFSLDEASPLGVRRGRAAVGEPWVEGVVGIRLHLQPAGGTWGQLELWSHWVLSIRVTPSVLPSKISVLILCWIIHRINVSRQKTVSIIFVFYIVWQFSIFSERSCFILNDADYRCENEMFHTWRD